MTGLEQLLTSLISGLPDPAAIVDRSARILEYNRPLLGLSGLNYLQMKRRVAEGVTLRELIRAAGAEDILYLDRCFVEGKVFRLAEVSADTNSGQSLVLWQAFIPIHDKNEETTRVLVIFRDVSSEARMQARFRELVTVAEARAEDLEFLVAQRTSQLTTALEEVTRLSKTDPLTGLANRRAFFETAEREVSAALRYDRPFSILMCDIDYFKRVNDTCGHQTGDHLLVQCAESLKKALRKSDILARFGGEEFIALLLECTSAAAVITAERCRLNIASTATCPKKELPRPLTASFGVASFPKDGRDLTTLIQRADTALYVAKAEGRNTVRAYDSVDSVDSVDALDSDSSDGTPFTSSETITTTSGTEP